jgi:hypothetical protein
MEQLLHPTITLAKGLLAALYGDFIFQGVNYSTIKAIEILDVWSLAINETHVRCFFYLFHLLKMP